jgi:hypothetical protein
MVVICLFMPTVLLSTHVYAQKDENLKVAFIRGGELWVKQNAKEQQITHEKYVLNPKWSYNGENIAYSSGKNADIISVYSLKTNKSLQIYKGGSHFKWAPNSNILAFQIDQVLNKIEVFQDHVGPLENVSLGVGNYSWLPDGSGFLVSSDADLLPTGWTDVGLASDGSTLCLLSADTKIFKTLDYMLPYYEWFQWAPQRNLLAVIQGEGREAVRNKHLKVMNLPDFKAGSFSVNGFVDQDFTWNNDQTITVSRAKETQGLYNAEHTKLPVLYRVHLQNSQQKQITFPPEEIGDYNPYFLKNSHHLTWFRADQKQSNVWIANSDGSKAKELIHNVDMGMNYYGKFAWQSIIAWYEPHEIHSMNTLYGEPAYAKWGQLAMTHVKNKYDANIVDYKHLGRKEINSNIAEENFKFWLRSSSREFGVYVKIRFELSTDKVHSISIQEV